MKKTLMNIVLPILTSIVLLIYALSITHELFMPHELEFSGYIFRSIILMISFGLFLFGISKIKKLTNSFIILGTSYFLFIILEIFFTFTAISNSDGTPLMAKNWMKFYWEENELGYRDLPIQNIDRVNVKNIFVIGDSYIAGHGIKNESDRISNILRNNYTDCFDVFNISKCGANTKDQLLFLESFPIKPDLIIVSHIRNDIEETLGIQETDLILEEYRNVPIELPIRFSQTNSFLVNNSFLINLIDFIIYTNKRTQQINKIAANEEFTELINKSRLGEVLFLKHYKIDTLISSHFEDLMKFNAFSIKHNSDILFILFSDADDRLINYTNEIVNKPLMKFFNANNIESLNLTPIIKSLDYKKRIVNKYDSHPSKELNIQVALKLESEIQNRFGMHCN